MEVMRPEETVAFAARNRIGFLGLARGDRAYVVPLFYGFDGRTFYFHTRRGNKTPFLDATEEACLVVTRAHTEDEWASVMAFGHVREVTSEPELFVAMDALLSVPLPPEFGFTPFGEPRRSPEGMGVYALTPSRLTGRKSHRAVISEEEREIALGGM